MRTITEKIINDVQHTPFTRIVLTSSVPHHNHTFYEFAILLNGSYTNVINDETYRFHKGSIIMLRPEDHHYYTASKVHTHQDVYVLGPKLKSICDCISPYFF